ncbi:MAG TPA: hypothetical protein VLJ58_19590 [Ramlibacter sp.]|nr:hypothetical protein [Ramlibacter sp.]
MRRALVVFSSLGFGIFAAVFVVSFANPLLIEQAAREIVRMEVERRVGARIDALSNSSAVGLAQKALGKTDAELEAARRSLADEVPRKVANVVADMLNADCTCRKRLVDRSVKDHEERIATLGQARERLVGLIESAYTSVTANLLREMRISTASNAVAFAALGLVTFFRRRAALQLVLPAIVLVGATGISGALYLFNQNWVHTVIYGQYVGFAYAAYLVLAAVFLADVVFNRARVTTRLLNHALSAAGSALYAIPC